MYKLKGGISFMNENLTNEHKRIIKFNAKTTAINSMDSHKFFTLTRAQKESFRDETSLHVRILLEIPRENITSHLYFCGKYLKYLVKIINERLDGEEIQEINNIIPRNI
jgi:hypothetical protein